MQLDPTYKTRHLVSYRRIEQKEKHSRKLKGDYGGIYRDRHKQTKI